MQEGSRQDREWHGLLAQQLLGSCVLSTCSWRRGLLLHLEGADLRLGPLSPHMSSTVHMLECTHHELL
jgi:hypothetical protein